MDSIDNYIDEMVRIVNAPLAFRPHINVEYPRNNKLIFEEWFRLEYLGSKSDRMYLDIFWTSYHVNHNYGNDAFMMDAIQRYVDGLDRSKKYFTICQYDDSVLVDFKDLDILRFEMSKKIGVEIPLLCQPHPYKFDTPKKWLVSFVGGRTHPIRNELERLKANQDYYVSYDLHDIETYCKIIHESVFTLCPRGYGENSFRTCEALQYGSIPIYISDQFIGCFGVEFLNYGWKITNDEIGSLEKYIQLFSKSIIEKQEAGRKYYEEYYTYEGCFKHIIETLETEYNSRQ